MTVTAVYGKKPAKGGQCSEGLPCKWQSGKPLLRSRDVERSRGNKGASHPDSEEVVFSVGGTTCAQRTCLQGQGTVVVGGKHARR